MTTEIGGPRRIDIAPVDASRFADLDIALFRSFYERSGLRVARLDRQLRIAAANGEFQRDFGGSRRNLHGVGLTELLHPDYREQVERQLLVLLDQPGGRYVEQVALRADGQVLSGRLTAPRPRRAGAPLHPPQGAPPDGLPGLRHRPAAVPSSRARRRAAVGH